MSAIKKLSIGFITYGEKSAAYLPYFLDSLFCQTYSDFNVLAVDCSNDGGRQNIEILEKYPEIKIISHGANFGFGKSFNLMINESIKNGAEYFLALNPDMLLEPDFVKKILNAIESNNTLGSVSPKIYKWNFISKNENAKTNIIDSCGIVLKSGLRFFDLGQGQVDGGQFDKAKILGPSGAAAMYRIKALEKIRSNNQYFDERMFMYKEDCDLAYRLFLAGWESKLAVDAKIYHDRTAVGAGESGIKIALNRKKKSRQVKRWSLVNQLIIYKKFWHLQSSVSRFAIARQIFLMFIFSFVFEQYLLIEFFKILHLKVKKYQV